LVRVIALRVGKSEMARQGLVGRGFMAGADLVWIGQDWPIPACPFMAA